MSIIARATTSFEEGHYSIGAFVCDEYRGEGVTINGRFFITVHGAGGEKVRFKLYDRNTALETLKLIMSVGFEIRRK